MVIRNPVRIVVRTQLAPDFFGVQNEKFRRFSCSAKSGKKPDL